MKRSASSSPRTRGKRRARRPAGLGLFLAVVAGVFVCIVAACSNQGEGERCQIHDDCKTDEGLICMPVAQLPTGAQSDRCCPPDPTRATHPICKGSVEIGDASTPADTGPAPSDPIDVDAAETSDADVETDASDTDAETDADTES